MTTANKRFYVYELRDPDGVVFYVGKGTKNRINMHKTPSVVLGRTHLYCKIRSLHSKGLTHTAHKVFETASESEAFKEEIRLIAFYGRSNLCNLTDGGEGASGYRPSVDTLKKRGAAIKENWKITREMRVTLLKGRKATQEQRRAISERMKNSTPERLAAFRAAAPQKGHKVSPETREKMRKANGRQTPERRLKNSNAARRRVENNTPHWQKFREAGMNPTEETRKKMGRKGRVMSEEARKKMSDAKTGVVFSTETRAKISKALTGKQRPRKTYSHTDGKSYTAYQLANMMGAGVASIYWKLRQGWSVQRILSTPIYPRPNRTKSKSPKRVIALADDKRAAVGSAISAMPDIEDEPSFE